MDIEKIKEYCMNKHKACETYPFGEIPICYKLNNKIFAQLYDDKTDLKITLKCPPDVADYYRHIYPGTVVRGYHCPPVQQPYWNTIYFEDFPDNELLNMIDIAYETVFNSFSKRIQKSILNS
ncbi:MAG: MmcQ/YjbR family DNA-binding protein [Acutalibacteraceae bacterium]